MKKERLIALVYSLSSADGDVDMGKLFTSILYDVDIEGYKRGLEKAKELLKETFDET